MLRREPRYADAHFLLGIAAAGTGRFAAAVDAIERALALAPGRADYHAQHARCLSMLQRERAARAAAERALALGPRDALTFDTVGVVLARAGLHERAAEAFRRATALAPARADFQYNLGTSLRILGDFAGAEAAFERAVRIEPRFFRAYSVLAELRSARPDRTRVERLRALLPEALHDVDGELHLRHAIATELEALGDYDGAFAELEAGKRRKRAAVGYDFDADRALFERVEAVCDEQFVGTEGTGYHDDAPIFVVGMPRTGTTLVERILASHSRVASVGESMSFGIALKRATGTASPRVLDAETIGASVSVDLRQIGRAYVEGMREIVGDAPRFVDKMPLNFFYAAFICAALPGARIVCVRRNPLDTCVASYRRLFATGFPYYRYAYDLADIGRYYVCFDRLMRHWRRVLGARFYEVEYEALVAAPREEIRRLLEHVGLEWEEACLDFHRSSAPVATASAVQVREPLHGRYIGRWRRYAGRLGGLIDQLRAAGIELGDAIGAETEIADGRSAF